MLLLVIWLFLSLSPAFLKAYPVQSQVNFQDRSALPAHLSEPADYPDLTNGLTDAEVQQSLEDLTLDDLDSLNKLLDEHISQNENADTDVAQNRQAKATKHTKQALQSSAEAAVDDGCRDDEDLDDTKSNQCTKRTTCQTTKRCPKKTTSVPKTTRTCVAPRPTDNCKPKSGGNMDDDLITDTTKSPRPIIKKYKKSKDDLECDANDFLCHAMKRDRNKEAKSNLQEAVVPESKQYVPGKELAGIDQLGEEIIPAFNDQGEPLDETLNLEFFKTPKQEVNLKQSAQQKQQTNFELENDASLEQDHQSELELETNPELENQSNQKKEDQISLKQQQLNIKKNYEANLKDLKLDNQKKVRQEHEENLNHEDREIHSRDNVKQEHIVKLKQEEEANLYQDYQSNFERDNLEPENVVQLNQKDPAKFCQDYHSNFEREREQLANLELRNQNSLKQENLNHEHQATLDFSDQGNFKEENQANFDLGNRYDFEQEQKIDLELDNRAKFDYGEQACLHQGKQAYLHQGDQQIYRDQKESANNMEEARQVAEEPAPLDSNKCYQLSRIDQRKRKQAEVESPIEEQFHNVDEKKQIVTKNELANADLGQQESCFDSDSFIANNARDPPRYLIQMQDECIQSENDRGDRRLREDRSQSEALNLEKLAEEEEVGPMEDFNLEAEYKRSKRENKETDDAPENSKETYIKKLMDSFPRDQGGQINDNAGLMASNLAHLRIKRS
ncbi:trichohyalin isoform X2 [Drosophila gunungcola]|uniref:trichohyalin isoform X2 n=1 Tax=Drosophila gunungcola TaxID=103775 RepID=UPI0022E930EF|nr:trichohyalin isoform X2 [Drosophila gunungcola]